MIRKRRPARLWMSTPGERWGFHRVGRSAPIPRVSGRAPAAAPCICTDPASPEVREARIARHDSLLSHLCLCLGLLEYVVANEFMLGQYFTIPVSGEASASDCT